MFQWWAERDSNPRSRRQGIYSPPHLATLESAREKKKIQNRKYKITASYIFNSVFLLFTFIFSIWKWSHLSDLNRRPSAYKAGALPAELKWHIYLPFWLRGKYYKLSNESQIFFRIFYRIVTLSLLLFFYLSIKRKYFPTIKGFQTPFLQQINEE